MENWQKCLNESKGLQFLKGEPVFLLEKPKRVIEFTFPVKMDDNSTKIFEGYRVQFNDARGPFKGGIRFHPEVDKSEVEQLAFLMTLKCALANIPLGGGKGGVTVDPKKLSTRELELVSRGYMRELAPFIGVNVDIPAPDVNTTPQVMAWMLDEYEKIKGHKEPGVITGKPLELGGSKVRDVSTALGGFFVLEEHFNHNKLSLKGVKVAVQGFGNAGMHIASLLYQAGAVIVAASDSTGGVYNATGLNVPALSEFKAKSGALKGFSGSKEISNEALLELPVDVLIPAALDGAISEKNVSKVRANVILELANGPVTFEADKILASKNIVVIPDFLANAGGVTVSYFEWVQNRTGYYWSETEVKDKLKVIMNAAYQDTAKLAKTETTTLRLAAYALAIKRVLNAQKLKNLN